MTQLRKQRSSLRASRFSTSERGIEDCSALTSGVNLKEKSLGTHVPSDAEGILDEEEEEESNTFKNFKFVLQMIMACFLEN